MNILDFHWLDSSRIRIATSTAVACAAGLLLPHHWPVELRGLSVWNLATLCYLLMAWRVLLTSNAGKTQRLSTMVDDSRATIDALLVAGSLISVGGVLIALHVAGQLENSFAMWLTVSAILTVILSWLLIHTVYALHYARVYYNSSDGEGVDFHTDEKPDYLDFCYLSFAVGMTFGATDTEIGGRKVRRVILKHAVLSFFFATVVVGLTISIITGLVSSSAK